MARAELSMCGATRWMLYSARAWTLVWASLWTIGPIVALFDPQAGVIPIRKWVLVSPLEVTLMILFLGGAAVPWLRERAGGAVLVLPGVLALGWAGSSTSLWAPILAFSILPRAGRLEQHPSARPSPPLRALAPADKAVARQFPMTSMKLWFCSTSSSSRIEGG